MNRRPGAARDLAARHEIESRFHDHKYGDGEGYPRHYSLQPTYPVYERMLEMAGDLSGCDVLEFGCGEGWITHDLLTRGARVRAFDISSEAVQKTRDVVEANGYSDRCEVRQMAGERLEYPDASFDVAVGFAIIHHLDLDLALPELHRVLRPGGVAWFAEPLGTNPLINLYRRATPQFRTPDEEPLDLAALEPLFARFRSFAHTDFYLTALLAIALAYLPFGDRLFRVVNAPLMALDDRLLRRFPRLGRFAWYSVVRLER